MTEFKYPLGTNLRRGLTEARVIGHVVFENGTRDYMIATWVIHEAGYRVLAWAADLIENDPQVKAEDS